MVADFVIELDEFFEASAILHDKDVDPKSLVAE
jgi:hypothetical protein